MCLLFHYFFPFFLFVFFCWKGGILIFIHLVNLFFYIILAPINYIGFWAKFESCIFVYVVITGARGTDHPPFSNFLFTNLFSIKKKLFLSSLFSYFNLFVSIFIQSYVKIKLHVTLYRPYIETNNTQSMQLGRFKNHTPARFEYMYCILFPLCHSN